jgi:hypothetical protein
LIELLEAVDHDELVAGDIVVYFTTGSSTLYHMGTCNHDEVRILHFAPDGVTLSTLAEADITEEDSTIYRVHWSLAALQGGMQNRVDKYIKGTHVHALFSLTV